MKSKTHIFILNMREIIYTIIFSKLAIILIILLIYMFGSKDSSETMSDAVSFVPGIYTSSVMLDNSRVNIQVTVEESGITSVSLADPDETIISRYPLLKTCTKDISEQLAGGTALNDIEYTTSNQYTVALLVEAINNVLQKAAP